MGDGVESSVSETSGSLEYLPERFSAVDLKSRTVKFHFQGNPVFTQTYQERMTIQDIKGSLASMFTIPSTVLVLKLKNEILPNMTRLRDIESDSFGMIELHVESCDLKYRISTENIYRDLTVPDIITVQVQTEDKGIMSVVVEIEDRKINKPFLGGYVNTNSGFEYHHGYTQTGPPPPKVPPHLKNHRDTQTVFVRNRRQQMTYETATQMNNLEIWIPNVTDKILIAKPYETAEEREKRIDILGKVRTIQRYYRAWKMKKALKELSAEYKKRIQKELEADDLEKKMDEDRRKRDLICKVFPYTSKDFSMLYAMLESWKKSEVQRINATLCGPAKLAELYLLLDKEIEMLRNINKLYQQANQNRKLQKDIDFFKKVGTPIEWNSDYRNLHIEMDTLETQRAREFHTLYETFANRTYSKEERLQALIDVKSAIGNHHCDITIELNSLIDRMCDLLARDLDKHLDNLQRRMESLLLQHIKTTACNEGITNRLHRVKEKLMENNLYFCQRCQKLKNIESFAMNARTTKVRICNACNAIDKSSEVWVDLSPYNFILKQIRRTELINHSPSSVVFIFQDKDIYHLITVVWHSHSALSECNDISNLRLIRWDKNENWSPWNCILLTQDEAKEHLRIEDLEKVYEKEFLNHIFNKHALARKEFSQLADIDEAFTQRGREDYRLDGTKEYKKFIAVNSKTRLFYSCH